MSRYTTACSRVLQRFTVGSLFVRDRAGRRANRSPRGLELCLAPPPPRHATRARVLLLEAESTRCRSRCARSATITEFEFHMSPSRGHRDPRRASKRTVPAPARAVHDLDRRSIAVGFNGLDRRLDSAVAPLMDLVAKDPNSTGLATVDRTFCNAPADRRACHRRAPVRSRSFLRTANFEGRVMEVAGRSVRKARGHRLEDAAVEPNKWSPAQRQPVKVNGGGHPLRPTRTSRTSGIRQPARFSSQR